MSEQIIRIGSRGSRLAVIQSENVIGRLKEKFPRLSFELIKVQTSGDKDDLTPLTELGGTGIFVKELENALADNRIDAAVHSAKDLPSTLQDGFAIGATPERASVEDVMVCRKRFKLAELPSDYIVATGSVRRKALIKWLRPDLRVIGVRGNVDTRLRKLKQAEFDAIILARAGLERLGRESEVTQVLPPEKFPPAPGQGVIAIEYLAENKEVQEIIQDINDPQTYSALQAERSLLRRLNAGCSSALSGYARWVPSGNLRLRAGVLDPDGTKFIRYESECDKPEEAEDLGIEVAEMLLEQGAKELIGN